MTATITPTTSPQYWPLSSTHVLVSLEIVFALVMLTFFSWLTPGGLLSPEQMAVVWIVVVPTAGYFISTLTLTPSTITQSTTNAAQPANPVLPTTAVSYWPLSITHVLVTLIVAGGIVLLDFFGYLSGGTVISGEYLAAVNVIGLPVVSWFVSNIAITPTSITETTTTPAQP